MDQQIMIVQMAMYPIVLTKLSTEYDLATRKYNYFNFEDVSLVKTNWVLDAQNLKVCLHVTFL